MTLQIVTTNYDELIASADCLFSCAMTPDSHAERANAHYTVHHNRNNTVLAWVVPDAVWPGMFRVHYPDGTMSDLTNLTRACDGALLNAARMNGYHHKLEMRIVAGRRKI